MYIVSVHDILKNLTVSLFYTECAVITDAAADREWNQVSGLLHKVVVVVVVFEILFQHRVRAGSSCWNLDRDRVRNALRVWRRLQPRHPRHPDH